jgi:hypothetical protein
MSDGGNMLPISILSDGAKRSLKDRTVFANLNWLFALQFAQ